LKKKTKKKKSKIKTKKSISALLAEYFTKKLSILTKILPKCSSLNFRVNASNLGKFPLSGRVHQSVINKEFYESQ